MQESVVVPENFLIAPKLFPHYRERRYSYYFISLLLPLTLVSCFDRLWDERPALGLAWLGLDCARPEGLCGGEEVGGRVLCPARRLMLLQPLQPLIHVRELCKDEPHALLQLLDHAVAPPVLAALDGPFTRLPHFTLRRLFVVQRPRRGHVGVAALHHVAGLLDALPVAATGDAAGRGPKLVHHRPGG